MFSNFYLLPWWISTTFAGPLFLDHPFNIASSFPSPRRMNFQISRLHGDCLSSSGVCAESSSSSQPSGPRGLQVRTASATWALASTSALVASFQTSAHVLPISSIFDLINFITTAAPHPLSASSYFWTASSPRQSASPPPSAARCHCSSSPLQHFIFGHFTLLCLCILCYFATAPHSRHNNDRATLIPELNTSCCPQ